VFVATFGASSYTYVEATAAQDLRSFITAHRRGFEFFGGVPEVVVPDNLKTGVTHASRWLSPAPSSAPTSSWRRRGSGGEAAGAAVGVALLGARLDQVSLEREQLLVKKASRYRWTGCARNWPTSATDRRAWW